MISLIEKLYPKKDAVMQCHMEAGNITTNVKAKIDFTLPELSAPNILMYNCHVDDSAKGRYEMVLHKYILKLLGFNIKISLRIIEAKHEPLKGSTTPMVDLGRYEIINLDTVKLYLKNRS